MSFLSAVKQLVGRKRTEEAKPPANAVTFSPEVEALKSDLGNTAALFSGPEQLANIAAPGQQSSIGLVRTIKPDGTVDEKYEPITTGSARARRQAARGAAQAPESPERNGEKHERVTTGSARARRLTAKGESQPPKSAARRELEEKIAYQTAFRVQLGQELKTLKAVGHLPDVIKQKKNDIVVTTQYLNELQGNLEKLIAAEASGSSVPNAAAATIGAGETSTSGFGQAATKLSQAEQVLLEMIAERTRLMNQRNAYGNGQDSQRQLTDANIQALTQKIDEVSAQINAGKQQLVNVLTEELAQAQTA